MTRTRIEQILKDHYAVLNQQFKVSKIGIFGSYAAGRANENSDVDILVEFSEPVGWEFTDLHDYIESILNKKVDLATAGSLKPQLKDSILNEIIYL
ncbi:MAG: nucleotidyltransferase family protein [Desulfobacteraceae bacterium]|nr:nucleotidyltransferase family protein [Desulfobacteraceae bacterium]